MRNLVFFSLCISLVGCQMLSGTTTEEEKKIETPGTRKFLTLALAKRMAQAIESAALENQETVSISIFDIGGDIKFFQRMENSGFASIKLSQLKAKTSVLFSLSSKQLAEKNAKIVSKPYSFIPGVVLLAGGLPVFTKENEHIGSVGVSGSSGDKIDEELAQKGIDAIVESL
jgi:glc operon protein GlcG